MEVRGNNSFNKKVAHGVLLFIIFALSACSSVPAKDIYNENIVSDYILESVQDLIYQEIETHYLTSCSSSFFKTPFIVNSETIPPNNNVQTGEDARKYLASSFELYQFTNRVIKDIHSDTWLTSPYNFGEIYLNTLEEMLDFCIGEDGNSGCSDSDVRKLNRLQFDLNKNLIILPENLNKFYQISLIPKHNILDATDYLHLTHKKIKSYLIDTLYVAFKNGRYSLDEYEVILNAIEKLNVKVNSFSVPLSTVYITRPWFNYSAFTQIVNNINFSIGDQYLIPLSLIILSSPDIDIQFNIKGKSVLNFIQKTWTVNDNSVFVGANYFCLYDQGKKLCRN